MAGETYYYLFSLIFTLSALLYLVNLVCIRKSGKTTFGLSYKLGSSEYKRGVKFANNLNIAIASVILIALATNLAYDINRLLSFEDQSYGHGLLKYGTIAIVLMFIAFIPIGRRQARIVAEMGKIRNKK